MRTAIYLAVIAVLIGCAAFFASSETAFWSISRVKMRQMLKKDKKKAEPVAKLKSKPDNLLTLLLIGNNFVNALASALATSIAIEIAGSKGPAAATLILTLLMLAFGEILPKTLASYTPEQTAQRSALPLMFLCFVFRPLIAVFNVITSLVVKLFSALQKKKDDAPSITEDELKTLIDVGNEEGTLETGEKDMLFKIFEFADLRVRDIQKHRSLVKYISEDSDYKTTVKAFTDSGFSRLPVYKDDVETITGLVHYKDVLFFKGARDSFTAGRIKRKVLYIPETIPVVALLQRFRTENQNFAVVVGELGSNTGIVTMDDVLKAVFGRVTDEYNTKTVPAEERIRITGNSEFLIPGDMLITDVNSIFRQNFESEDFDTIGGWLLEQFGSLPETGEKLKKGNLTFTVEDQAARRIQTIRLKFDSSNAFAARLFASRKPKTAL